MAKILVTGGLGFIGYRLVEKLRDKNEITIVDNLSSSSLDFTNLKENLLIKDVSRANFNIDKKFDIVFHMASITDTLFKDDKKMFRNNVEGLYNALKIAEKNNAKFIYASSAGVYGNTEPPQKENQDIDPNTPLNMYSYSKLRMEVVANFLPHEIPTIVGLRYFNVFGPGEGHKDKSASMIYQLYQQMRGGENPKLFKFGEQRRDFIYIDDVVTATIKAVKAKSGIYNVGTGTPTSFNEIVRILNKILKTNYQPEYIENPHDDAFQVYTLADTTKAENELKFKAKNTLNEGILKYIRWLEYKT